MKPILPPAPVSSPLHAAAVLSGPPVVLLACGNALRQDDGVGLRIAEAAELMAEKAFPASRLRIVAAPQWTPEMAVELAEADLAIFVDACVDDDPGSIRVTALSPPAPAGSRGMRGAQTASAAIAQTHGLDPQALLGLAGRLCGHTPARAFVLTVGAASLGYGEGMTGPLRQAVPRAVRLVGNLLAAFSA